ncbi:MAG: sigma-70 family RNA polymerase sigma factor [Kiritimatiellae bacterium]|nr:sigma-70 family RNA polymerase sigma factor [Kiritimatiellia bacterium]
MSIDREPNENEIVREAMQLRTRVLAYLMGLVKDPQKAEDLLQDTYVVVLRKWQQYQPGTNLLAWMLSIARREFLNAVKPAHNRLVAMEMEVLEKALVATQEDDANLAYRREALSHCLAKLRPQARDIMQLRYGDGLSCGEVCRRVRLSLNALYTVLCRVRENLKTCIERQLRVQEAP